MSLLPVLLEAATAADPSHPLIRDAWCTPVGFFSCYNGGADRPSIEAYFDDATTVWDARRPGTPCAWMMNWGFVRSFAMTAPAGDVPAIPAAEMFATLKARNTIDCTVDGVRMTNLAALIAANPEYTPDYMLVTLENRVSMWSGDANSSTFLNLCLTDPVVKARLPYSLQQPDAIDALGGWQADANFDAHQRDWWGWFSCLSAKAIRNELLKRKIIRSNTRLVTNFTYSSPGLAGHSTQTAWQCGAGGVIPPYVCTNWQSYGTGRAHNLNVSAQSRAKNWFPTYILNAAAADYKELLMSAQNGHVLYRPNGVGETPVSWDTGLDKVDMLIKYVKRLPL